MRPEILAPVGSVEALNAALAAGCDAVYFGLPSFGARAFANNFDLETTKEVIERCHLCGVKVYITMNTILYEDEIEDAYNMAKMVHSFGVDALIIQDLGFIHLLHHRLPNLVLHASTQLSVSNPYQIEQLKKLGVQRVVLARECTKEEIQACVDTGIEVEVLCMELYAFVIRDNVIFKYTLWTKWKSWNVCTAMSNEIHPLWRWK